MDGIVTLSVGQSTAFGQTDKSPTTTNGLGHDFGEPLISSVAPS